VVSPLNEHVNDHLPHLVGNRMLKQVYFLIDR